MQLTSNEILAKIPGSWSEVTLDMWLNTFMKLNTYKPEVDDPLTDVYVSLQVISSVTGLSMDIVQKFPLEAIKQCNKKLAFLGETVDKKYKARRKWIQKMDDPTYDDFITFINVSKQINEGDYSNFPLIIKSIIREPITDEEIMQLPMDEVNAGFFFLRGSLNRYLKSITKDWRNQAIALTVREEMEKWEEMTYRQKSGTIRRLFRKLTDGTFSPRKSQTGQDSLTTR